MIYTLKKAASFVLILSSAIGFTFSQNALWIPDTISGTIFNLTAQPATKTFFQGYNTPTFSYNGNFLGPTLLINKGDSITLNVTNNLSSNTTVHWHGFHVAPENDGGPHQIISPNTTWSPRIKMLNNASTFWYHPHGESKTEMQISKGLAGVIIVRDSIERTYTLPRKYGKDDFPLIMQSRAFDVLYQIAVATHEDSVMMVNGTIDPYLQVPKQVVRLRLLNASADRTFYLGLNDNSNFHLIAIDGGLLSQPYSMNRLRLSTGERAEILVNFDNYSVGQQIYLMSYASELPRGIIGADSVGTSSIVISEGYYSNPLNGTDFNVLRFDITPATSNPVTTIPAAFIPVIPLDTTMIDAKRELHFGPDTSFSGSQAYVDGPFHINNQLFHMDSVNIFTYLNNKEVWTLTNSSMVAHPFHIHDIQFNVLDINGDPPPPEYSGLKDVMLVKPNDTVRFITKFENFANNMVPYMYHCHLLHHEDEGMMGTFLVLDTTTMSVNEKSVKTKIIVYPNPSANHWILNGNIDNNLNIELYNSVGQLIYKSIAFKREQPNIAIIDNSNLNNGVYFLKLCSENEILGFKLIKN